MNTLNIGNTQAITVDYQPTPYPLKMQSGNAMPQGLDQVHIHDGWLNSRYAALMSFQRDEGLNFGGYGSPYRAYINVDFTGLPMDSSEVDLYLRFHPSSTNATPFQFCIPNQSWDTTMTWGSQPTFLGCVGSYTPPASDSWLGWNITLWYQYWMNGSWGKYGIMINPLLTTNHFDFIRSSRYANFAVDPYADGKRPFLRFTFTPSA